MGVKLSSVAFLIYLLCPPFATFDSYWTVPAALSILRDGSTTVDDYVAAAPPAAGYSVECIPPHGAGRTYEAANGCPGGHFYNLYPVGVPVMALPLVLFLKAATSVMAALGPDLAWFEIAHPRAYALLTDDLYARHEQVEHFCAAVFAAITVWLQFRIASMFVDRRLALLLTAIFAFGTSEWTIGSGSLLQHGPTLLLLSLALYCLLRGWIVWAALPLAFSCTVRPTNLIPVVLLTSYVAIHHRARLVRFLLCSLPVAVLFVAYNLSTQHQLLPDYYRPNFSNHMPVLAGFAMNLISPSRGLLIYTPIVLFSVAGMVLAWRRRWCFPLSRYLIAMAAAHALVIAAYWPGHGYGPRYFTDITYLFTFFLLPLAPALRTRPLAAAAFSVLAIWGVFVQAHGATSDAVHVWDTLPANVDIAKGRVWDWSDPQFLRGLR